MASLLSLVPPPPRRTRRRRKNGDYSSWELITLTGKLLLTGCVCIFIGWFAFPLGLPLLLFGVLLSPFTLLMALGNIIEVSQHKWLIKHGCVAMGEILSNQAHNFPDFGGYHTVCYKMTLLEGGEIHDQWEYAEQPFWKSKAGDTFLVFYHPRKPTLHIPYDSSLYEIVGLEVDVD